MSGVLFVVCVPTSKHEVTLRKAVLQRMNSDKNNGNITHSRSSPIRPTASVADLKHAVSDNEDSAYHRSKSADCVRTRYSIPSRGQPLYIGPWCVDPGGTGELSDEGIQIRTHRREPCVAASAPTSTAPSPGRPNDYCRPQTSSASVTSSAAHSDVEESMEKELTRVLDLLGVKNAVWCMGKSEKFFRVTFSVHSGKASEEALRRLAECGIGERLNSVVSVIPCALYYQGSPEETDDDSEEGRDVFLNGKGFSTCSNSGCGGEGSCSAWESFVRSMRARITVAQVVEGVRANAAFTFDFVILLVVASIVAALGLLENNTLILAASMLISPLMGPVMAATFGTMLGDSPLRRMGVVNELSGLLMCLILGFAVGLIVGYIDRPWPIEDMLESQCVVSLLCRGHLRSLWVNVAIALLSGAAIAISLMRGNTGSLVGVAISASLMPPAVNAGLLWAMSVVHWSHGGDAYNNVTGESASFQYQYSNSLPTEFAVMGGVSLCLTVVNIVFIYLTGIIMLKIKEVSPVTSRGPSQQFWRHDVRIARDYNATMGARDGEHLREQTTTEIMNDFQRRSNGMCGRNVGGLEVPTLDSFMSRSFERETPQYTRFPHLLRNEATWSPSMSSIYLDLKKLCRIARRSYDFTHLREATQNFKAPCRSSKGSSKYQPLSNSTGGSGDRTTRRKNTFYPWMPTINGTPVTDTSGNSASGHSNSSSSFLTCCETSNARNTCRSGEKPTNDLQENGRDCSASAKKAARFTVTPAYDSFYSLTRPNSSASLQTDSTLEFLPNATGSPNVKQQ